MENQQSYQNLLKSRELLEKKVKKLEKELKIQSKLFSKPDTNNLYFQLFNKTNDIIIIHKSVRDNLTDQIIMTNTSAKKNLGYSEEEFRKMTLADLFDNKKSGQTPADIPIRLIPKSEQIIVSKNKKRIIAEVQTQYFDHKGKRYGYSVIHDITDHKNVSEAYHLTEEKYQRLVKTLSNDYIFYSRDRNGMITDISPSVKRLLGYSRDEALRNYKEFLTDHEINKKALVQSELNLKGILQPPFLNELHHRDGSTRIFHNTEIPVFDESGKLLGVEGIARDITDTLNREEQLKIHEERFRLLVETIEEVFWIFDLKEDKLLYISPKYEILYDRTTESLYNKPGSFLKSVHPGDIKNVKKAYKLIEKGKGFDLEYRLIDRDGRIKWIWSKSFLINDEKKKPVLVIGIAFDITDKKNARLETNLLAAIVENTEDHAVIKDPDLKIIASNRANTLAAGKRKAEELIGRTDLELYGDYPHVRQYLEDDRKAMQMKKGETLVNEQVFVYPDGRTVNSLVKKFPVFDENNKLIAVASISRDITRYKKALNDHAESEKNYQFLITNMENGLGIINSNYRFIFANQAAEEIFGMEKGKLIGKSLFQLLDKEAGKQIVEEFKVFQQNTKHSFQLSLNNMDGKKRIITMIAAPKFQNNRISEIFLVLNDVTQRVEIEKSLFISEKNLRDVNTAKDKFFSIIAHDLKNPFHSILNFSDMLLKHYPTYDKEEVLTFVKMIHESSRQAYNLLENLLSWSRAQTGKMEFDPSQTDMHEIISDNISLLEGTALEKNITLENEIRKGTFAFCDPNMISTVIRNLLSNAIKYTRPTGKVIVNSKSGSRITEISITDTGVGIKNEDLKKLFKIDAHFTTIGTANEEGTGLGLILCQEFVNINKGKIKVISKEGKGTTFYLELPKTRGNKTKT